MESFNKIEKRVPDKRKELINGLREKGIENPEVLSALNAWTIEQEEKVETAGNTPEARVKLEIDRAKLYAESDYIDEALDTLYDALYIAQSEGLYDFEGEIRKEIRVLDLIE